MNRKRKARRRQGGSRPNLRKQARAAESRPQQSAPTPAAAAKPPSTIVALEPLAPIIVRSGRPFDSTAGVDEARFPPPSTIAGCLRTAWARAAGQPFGRHLATHAIRGPLLVNSAGCALAPKPADAQYVDANSPRCVRSKPVDFEPDCDADLPAGMQPVRLAEPAAGKPVPGPRWWAWEHLLAFRRGEEVRYEELEQQGWTPADGDRRTHVALDRNTRAADTGQLFQTEGLVLESRTAKDAARNGLRLLACFDEPMRESIVPLGGERRLAALAPQPESPESVWPVPPSNWLQDIVKAGGLCLTLLTPGIFSAGFRPGWLNDDLEGSPPEAPGLRLQLQAAAIERWQPHSGWDLANQQPRPSRKLAAAGATYWFRIVDGADADVLQALWLANVSDREQDRRDGFGLALPSPWSPDEGASI